VTTILNEAQSRRLTSSLRYIDRLLTDIAQTLSAPSPPSPFTDTVPDATPLQAKVMGDLIARFRETTVRSLAAFGLEPPPPQVSAVWSARVTLTSTEIAVEDLRPAAMRGYGELNPGAARSLEVFVAELGALLRQMADYLAQGPGADLQARIERMEIAGDVADLLRRLERVVTELGMVELRTELERLVARLESPSFEIALFGRVSAGKSSLLNRVLRRGVLPVGVTPVTAVPVRIHFGETAEAQVSFADGSREKIPLQRLAEYATEEGNPGNSRHVASIEVALDEPRLQGGVTLVDTPGLGSLATSGAAETLAYLPRCDLGVVLLDGASSPALEDFRVVESLIAAGSRAMVLVSKADLLNPADRDRMARYVRESLRSQAGVDVPVRMVSVMGEDSSLADQWFEREILPLAARQRQEAMKSIRRKAGRLRDLALRLLREWQRRPEGDAARAPMATEEELRHTRVAVQEARRRCDETLTGFGVAANPILARTAADLAASWPRAGFLPSTARETLRAAIEREVNERVKELVGCVEDLRREVTRVLTATGGPGGEPGEAEIPRPAGLPRFDPEGVAGGLDLGRPALAYLGRSYLRRRLFRDLSQQVGRRLHEDLAAYRRVLEAWSRGAVAEIGQAFEARAETLRARASGAAADPTAVEEAIRSLGAVSADRIRGH
jgi:GTP-binding protein EngB required for normal cell division